MSNRPYTLGTLVELPDGRIGTVVYNSLIGVGIKWGDHHPDPADFFGTSGNTVEETVPDDWPWQPDALLRNPWPTCRQCGFSPEDCVGDEWKVLRVGLLDADPPPALESERQSEQL